jgi:hypothetical protein
MARILGLFPAALVAARSGSSANAFYQSLRDLGIAPRRTEALQLFSTAKGIVSRTPDEPFRNIHEVPAATDIGMWPSKKSTGIVQNVTLTYRDKDTGHIQQTWWRTVTPNGITREEALATAIDAYSEHAESYNQEIIGAVHTSAYRLTPGLV